MKKLLHERLRELPDGSFYDDLGEIVGVGKKIDGELLGVYWDKLMLALADEIEKYYVARLRYEDGEPVEYEAETEYGTVLGFVTYLGGFDYESVGLLTLENDIVIIPKRELLKRQTEVLDADGVEIRVGDTVWNTLGNKHTVSRIEFIGCHEPRVWYEDDKYDFSCSITHREPDNLEKLRDDMSMRAAVEGGELEIILEQFVERLDTIMERDA